MQFVSFFFSFLDSPLRSVFSLVHFDAHVVHYADESEIRHASNGKKKTQIFRLTVNM